jgi:hypothetical protein
MAASRPELFRGRHFRDDIIVLCVRWYLRYPLKSAALIRFSIAWTALSVCDAAPRHIDSYLVRSPG